MVILIDNGHGIETKGKCSPDGRLKEWAWARETAKKLCQRLISEGIDARLIVPEDTDISITKRVQRINNICARYGKKNVLLVSIHNNAAQSDGKWHDANGWSVFVSKNSSAESKQMATLMTDEAIRLSMTGDRFIPKEKYWTWSWTTSDIGILKYSNCPAVLTENYFQDNIKDVEYLLSEHGKEAIVDFHVRCIKKYIYRH